jgi:hypothetical protein
MGMKTRPVIVVNEYEPLLSDDDRLAAAQTVRRRPIDDLVRDPSIDHHSFGPRLDGSRWSRRRGLSAPIFPSL